MKTLFLLFFGLISFLGFSQTKVNLKARLYKPENTAEISIQRNKEPVLKMGQNIYKEIELNVNDKLAFFVNDNLVETIDISQKVIDRKSLSVLLTESTVLDEVEIEYTNLNNKLGFTGEKYTKAERAVKTDNQLYYKDEYSAVGGLKLDGLVNKLTGRAKANKKALSIENEINAMERFLNVYPADFLKEHYNLPKEKAPYFALHMMQFMNEQTKLESDSFRMIMEEQLLNFKYD